MAQVPAQEEGSANAKSSRCSAHVQIPVACLVRSLARATGRTVAETSDWLVDRALRALELTAGSGGPGEA